MRPCCGIPPGIGARLGIGIPPGIGAPLGIGIVLSGFFMLQHMPSDLGSAGGGGSSGWGDETATGRGVDICEDVAQAPAKKVATAMHAIARTAAITRLRSRRLLPNPPKNAIVDSFQSGEERLPPDDTDGQHPRCSTVSVRR
jgi:hypothetical protein